MVHHMHKPLPLPNAGKVKLIHFPKATLSREIFSGNVVCIREKQQTHTSSAMDLETLQIHCCTNFLNNNNNNNNKKESMKTFSLVYLKDFYTITLDNRCKFSLAKSEIYFENQHNVVSRNKLSIHSICKFRKTRGTHLLSCYLQFL